MCNGDGEINIPKHGNINCPECNGIGHKTTYIIDLWYIPDNRYYNFVVQKIGMELYNINNKKYNNERSWIYYMADSSGNMFNENDCFASIEEAQKECNLRNSKLSNELQHR